MKKLISILIIVFYSSSINAQVSFLPAINFTPGGSSFTNADFNGDGKMDLAIVGYWTDTASLLLGDGLGGFSAPMKINMKAPSAITSGDFNGDGKMDLATVDYNSSLVDSISIFIGNGLGSFSAPTTFSGGGSQSYFIIAADFNGDGKITRLGEAFNIPRCNKEGCRHTRCFGW